MTKLSSGEESKKFNLYVLRYNDSGNYYVGITSDFERRMLNHWRQTSIKSELPQWSQRNDSTKGFKFYWFHINNDGVVQSDADHCENSLAERLVQEIKRTNKEVQVGNGKFVDTEETDITTIEVKNNKNSINDMDKVIVDYLKNLTLLETKKGEFSIRCHRIGCVGEYDNSQCNESWGDVASTEFSLDTVK